MTRHEGEMVTRGTGNVYEDLGYADPEAMVAKAELVRQIAATIREQGWTQVEAADQVGLDQPAISRLLRGQFRDFGTDRLLRILTRLQKDVEIRISPANPAAPAGHISVFATGEDQVVVSKAS